MLKDIFTQLVGRYSNNSALAQTLWLEIEKAYSGKKRYYHNLQHLQNMYNELLCCRDMIADWDTLLFSVFYHDIVYKATSKENEEKSAEAALLRLNEINYPKEKINKCSGQIIATKQHGLSPDSDTNLLTDADLAILGADWDAYLEYSQAVRKEYAIYPDFLYKPGRAKALQHFIDMDTIFKTTYFQDKYQLNAYTNLKKELTLLV
jgi:predicted metal-dependent HD superfamily phosphohydrolase